MNKVKDIQEYENIHSEEFMKIKNHLLNLGNINISDRALERFYRVFCKEKYHAGYLSYDSVICDEFACFLSTIQIN